MASAFRLLIAPALACPVAIPFGLSRVEYASGVLQAGMPTAIIAAIIAKEHNIAPHFVTTVVLFTILASLVTLPLLMTFYSKLEPYLSLKNKIPLLAT